MVTGGLTKKDIDILEQRGLWKATSFINKTIRNLAKKHQPLEIRYFVKAHKIIFDTANQSGMAGKYRSENPKLERIDGTSLVVTHWANVPSAMAELDEELRSKTKKLKQPQTEEEYYNIISLAAKLSHRLACIHPFENGNGRMSRLLLNGVLLRVKLSAVAVKDKKRYLRAMRQADDSDFSLLEDIIIKGLIEVREKTYKILRRKQLELVKKKKLRNRR